MREFMDYDKILKHIYSLDSSKIKLGLDNMNSLLLKIGNPEKALKCIHVGGTNGKGSTSSMIYSALRKAGCNVGLYTSPHLKRFNERIRVNKLEITNKEIVDYYLSIKDKITNQSFFEITTAIAFLHFKKKNVDFAVLEVGLGGRLDATNAVTPLISVITNVDYEHTNLLGDTIEKISFEKAGIIKNNVPVVTGAEGKSIEVIKKIATERHSDIYIANKPARNIKLIHLKGSFQLKNAAIARKTLEVLNKTYNLKLSKKDIISGIMNSKWPARMQFVRKNFIVDCAHNPAGMKVLCSELLRLKSKEKFSDIIFVFGVLQDKNCKDMIDAILSVNPKKIILTEPESKRRLHISSLEKAVLHQIKKTENITGKISIINIKNPKKALQYAVKNSSKKDLIVAAGSIYMAGELT